MKFGEPNRSRKKTNQIRFATALRTAQSTCCSGACRLRNFKCLQPTWLPLQGELLCHATGASCGSSIETRSGPISLAATHRGFTLYIAAPTSSIETRSLPTLTRSYPRRFTFYVAAPANSIVPLNFGGSSSMPKLLE